MFRDALVIGALIEVEPSLVAFQEVDLKLHPAKADRELRVGLVALYHLLGLLEALQFAHDGIVAFHDRRWMENLFEDGHDLVLSNVHPERQRLEHETVAILVDDEAGKKIRFRVDDAATRQIAQVTTAQVPGRPDPFAEKSRVHVHAASRRHAPDGNLRFRVEEATPKRALAIV